jgi:aryl-alcohol dehydrogenase-like predicted oxidoreductase
LRTICQAIDAGINFFDVSDHHSQGIAERVLGQACGHRRTEIHITTKAGYRYSQLGDISLRVRYYLKPLRAALRPLKRPLHLFRASQGRYDFRPEHIAAALDRSLGRLGTDYVDLYQLYKPSVPTIRDPAFEDTMDMLARLRDSGKIRYYGIACQWVHEALQCLELPGISTVQVAVNLIEPEAAETLLDRAEEKHIAVIVRHPKAIGLLTDAGSDIMGDTSYYDRFRQERASRAADFRFLRSPERTLAQAAIRYVLQVDGIATVIPRAVNRKELVENLGALTAPGISDDEYRRIRETQASWEGPAAH